MTPTRLTPFAWMVLFALTAVPAMAQQEDANAAPNQQAPANQADPQNIQQAASLWEDFIHYTRVAQLDLAVSSGQALLQMNLPSDQLLQVVEEMGPYRDYDQTLQRAQRMEGPISQLADQISARLEQARRDLATEGVRIRQSILSLDDGLRARINAQGRLTAAGQYAAPQLLQVLLSSNREDEQVRPYVIEAMVAIGRPLVRPLSQALASLPPVPKQQVAEVLARIGYPTALPYISAELASGDLDPDTRESLQTAFDRIIERSSISRNTSAANLFLQLAQDYYNQNPSLLPEPQQPTNPMWVYDPSVGLVFLSIPTPIYYDVMAMRATRRALQLNPNLSAAMSLWIAANFRRENNLPPDASDPSYSPAMRSPHFYATLTGPRHLQPVLNLALQSDNSQLALDAIRALASTSGAQNLLNTDGNLQPLIAALNYPDQRVRFESAFAIARSMPSDAFSGDQRIVPVLAEAVRQGDQRHAVIIAPDTQTINETTRIVGSAGDYRALIGNSMDVVSSQVADAPGVDLIVLNTSLTQARGAIAAARMNYKLAGAPILVLVPQEQVPVANREFANDPAVFVTSAAANEEQLTQAVQQAASSAVIAQITEEQATTYAASALDILLALTLSADTPFEVTDAKPALFEALNDQRDPIVLSAADVLARFPSADAQQALAGAALSPERSEQMQVQLLNTLALSARLHGNQLTDRQLRDILSLVSSAQGQLADAAAEAHGALNLPTANAVELITSSQ